MSKITLAILATLVVTAVAAKPKKADAVKADTVAAVAPAAVDTAAAVAPAVVDTAKAAVVDTAAKVEPKKAEKKKK